MANFTEKDKARCLVRSVDEELDFWRCCIRVRHEDFDPRRWWSYCDLTVRLPRTAPRPEHGREAELVLECTATAAEETDGGAYACKVHEASQPPLCPPERPDARQRYLGLVEREEPPHSGPVILHLGSGVTCYVTLPSDFDGSAIEHFTWWEFTFGEGLYAAFLQTLDQGS